MNWRAQMAKGWGLSDEAMDLMEHGEWQEAAATMREANRLRGEALEWKWTHDPPPTFLLATP